MVDFEHALLLLNMGRKDLSALRGMRNLDVFAEEIFGFHVQQAAEKILKAWIALTGETVPRTHVLANPYVLC